MKTRIFHTAVFRIAIIVVLIGAIWGCGRVPKVSEIPPPANRLPYVNVLLDNSLNRIGVEIDGGQMALHCYKKGKRFSYFSSRPVIVNASGNSVELFDNNGGTIDYNIDFMVIAPREKNHILSYEAKKYRGLFQINAISGQLRIVNSVYVEDYLKGVVPHEIGKTPKEQFEAVKAQAVAARTYAMGHLGQYGIESGYDLKADITDQVYEGVAGEVRDVSHAIETTRGQVVVYNDIMIDAYYHSTCGGATDDIEDVWDKDMRPYLKMVHDDDACSISKYFTWTERFSEEQLRLRLEQYISRERGVEFRIGEISNIHISNYTPGGRIASITFETPDGFFIFNKEKVRWVIGRNDGTAGILRSARFALDIRRDANGKMTEVIFNGHGYGHGVGMCQMGARGLAARGVTFDSILSLYYQNTELKRLY